MGYGYQFPWQREDADGNAEVTPMPNRAQRRAYERAMKTERRRGNRAYLRALKEQERAR